MESLYDFFVAWNDGSIQPSLKSLIAASLVAVVCSVIGCFIILRRMAFLGDALAHAMLAGVVGGYLLMKLLFGEEAHAVAMLIGSVLAGLFTVAAINFVSRTSRIKEDTAIGMIYTGVFALGAVLVSIFQDQIHIDIYHFVVGTVLAVSDSELWLMGVVCAVVLAAVILFFRQLHLVTFDPVMATSIGVSVVAMDYLLTTCTSLVVVSAVNLVGVILVIGLLVTPAATAYLLSDRLGSMLVISAIVAELSVVLGLYGSVWLDVDSGPMIVVVSTGLFLVALVAAPQYGLIADWLRRRARVPQQAIEHVLLGVLRPGGEQVPLADVMSSAADDDPHDLERAIAKLVQDDKLARAGDQLSLTEAGREHATKLLRAHRLWEAYLERMGTPAEELHPEADRLEHIADDETLEYLDHALGHPERDPHGSEIPFDPRSTAPDRIVRASLLREGNAAQVQSVGPAAEAAGLEAGMRIVAGPREGDGERWTFRTETEETVSLDHAAADTVLVKRVEGSE